jgi:hypothetical protein
MNHQYATRDTYSSSGSRSSARGTDGQTARGRGEAGTTGDRGDAASGGTAAGSGARGGGEGSAGDGLSSSSAGGLELGDRAVELVNLGLGDAGGVLEDTVETTDLSLVWATREVQTVMRGRARAIADNPMTLTNPL